MVTVLVGAQMRSEDPNGVSVVAAAAADVWTAASPELRWILWTWHESWLAKGLLLALWKEGNEKWIVLQSR